MSYQEYKEYLKTPIFLAVRAAAMRMAKGMCKCGNPATEVHHKQYPVWGAYDVPANLEPVCHECHCKIHNKQN